MVDYLTAPRTKKDQDNFLPVTLLNLHTAVQSV